MIISLHPFRTYVLLNSLFVINEISMFPSLINEIEPDFRYWWQSIVSNSSINFAFRVKTIAS